MGWMLSEDVLPEPAQLGSNVNDLIVVGGNLTINAGVKDSMNLGATSPFIIEGNIINNGSIMTPAASSGSLGWRTSITS